MPFLSTLAFHINVVPMSFVIAITARWNICRELMFFGGRGGGCIIQKRCYFLLFQSVLSGN